MIPKMRCKRIIERVERALEYQYSKLGFCCVFFHPTDLHMYYVVYMDTSGERYQFSFFLNMNDNQSSNIKVNISNLSNYFDMLRKRNHVILLKEHYENKF
jgi:hypothetical protein